MVMYDVVIAGCGISGAIAGLTALEHDLDACIVECGARDEVGKKICGDLMLQESIHWIEQEFGISIEGYPLKGLEIRSSGKNMVHVPIPLCTVDRWKVGQACVDEFMERGGVLQRGLVRGPVMKNGSVGGVKTGDGAIDGPVTIDCSGVSAVLRRKIPLLSGEKDLLGLAYREILLVKDPIDLEYAVLRLDNHLIPAGYFWCFPKNPHEVNVGVGGLVKGQVQLKEKLDAFTQHMGLEVEGHKDSGLGVVPLGRALASQVYSGLLVCGDAANHVNPLTGEGIAPALEDGYHAGMTAAEAIGKGDTSLEGLWNYNVAFAQGYGKVHAPLVLLRDFLVSLSEEELNFLLDTVITGKDLGDVINGNLPSIEWRNISPVLSHMMRLPLFLRVYTVLRKMRQSQQLYTQFPREPGMFLSWKNRRDQLVGNAVKR